MRERIHERRQNGFLVSTDPARLNVNAIHEFLSRESYWALGRPRETTERAIAGSLPFGIYEEGGALVGFARVVTDRATFGYLADVFVLPPFRGQGLSKWLMQCILSHPDLVSLRRFLLVTRDAHTLYNQFGFAPLAHADRYMERFEEPVYDNPTNPNC